jgi:NADP-dependent 3-hydroxy acid dehydrogenase YdfG
MHQRSDQQRRQARYLKDENMQDKRIALVTGANQGVGRQVAKELVANGLAVLLGSRNFEHGEAAAKEITPLVWSQHLLA